MNQISQTALMDSDLKEAVTRLYSKYRINSPESHGLGSGVSPILANIYLSKLDDFAENLKKSFNKGKSKENLEYQRAASKLYYIRRKNRANWENWNEQQRKEALRLQKDAINYMHSLPSKRANNKEYKSLVYCRYADDFLIGVIGSFEDASEIKEKFR